MDKGNSVAITGVRGWREVEEGMGGQIVMDGDLTWGGTHNTAYRWYIVELCT